MQVEDL